jgi:hypothetical protein
MSKEWDSILYAIALDYGFADYAHCELGEVLDGQLRL